MFFIRHCLLFLLLVLAACFASAQATFIAGNQGWMSANLVVDHYTDGTLIPEARTKEEWVAYNQRKVGCWCNYDNESCYGSMYGKLYNWYAVKKGIAPHCWKVASKADYDRLITTIGETSAAKKLKATHSWNNDWAGNNSSRFAAFAGGCRNPDGLFSFVGREGFWWTSDPRKTGTAGAGGVFFFINSDDRYNFDVAEDFGYSVRCMRYVGVQPPPPCP